MVARIAPEPVASLAASDLRSRSALLESHAASARANDNPLPPVPAPIPTPVPAPIIAPTEAFTTSQLAEQLPVQPPSPTEVQLRTSGVWQSPESSLRLTDRQV